MRRAGGVAVGLTGGTGHIGSLLLGRLLADPIVGSVVSVARRPVAVVDARLRHVRADLRSPAARRALAGVDLCYHLGFGLWAAGGLADMNGVNLGGTANVLAARPEAVVFASSAAVYGAWPDNPLPLQEVHPPRPNVECPYAVDKLAAERLCLDAAPTTVVRLGAVLGPHADRSVARAVRGYRIAVPAVRGTYQAVQFLDEVDAVDVLLAAGRRLLAPDPVVGPAARPQTTGGGPPASPAPPGRLSAGALSPGALPPGALSPGALSPGAVAGAVCNAATPDWLSADGIAAISGGRVLPLPRRLLLGASEAGRRTRLLPFGSDRAVLLSGPMALDSSRAATLLGWTARRSSAEVLSTVLGR